MKMEAAAIALAFILTSVFVVIILLVISITSSNVQNSIRYDCQTYGATTLNGYVYTCFPKNKIEDQKAKETR